MSFFTDAEINKIKNILRNDGVIAFPTDTVWGIGCLPQSRAGAEKIYSVKSRDKGKPLILLGKNIGSLLPYVEELPMTAKKIMGKYFPGAVTLVLKKNDLTPDYYITSGFSTVGIRVPDCPVLLEILERCTEDGVLATTSANISEAGAVSTRQEVVDSIGDRISYVADDFGYLPDGKESTVVSVDEEGNLKVFRQGCVKISL